jgi:hypothetical protein
MEAPIHECDVVRRQALRRLQKEINASYLQILLAIMLMLVVPGFIYKGLVLGYIGLLRVLYPYIIILPVIIGFYYFMRQSVDRPVLKKTLESLLKLEPLTNAYRTGRSFVEEAPPKDSKELINLRDRYTDFCQLAKTYKDVYESASKNPYNKYRNEHAALLNDVEDAYRQAQKELMLLERAYHLIETPQIIVAPSPISSQLLTAETGLERY